VRRSSADDISPKGDCQKIKESHPGNINAWAKPLREAASVWMYRLGSEMRPTPVSVEYVEISVPWRNPKSDPVSIGVELIEASTIVRYSEGLPSSIRIKDKNDSVIHGYCETYGTTLQIKNIFPFNI
jgi:hypothetical protein